MKTVIGIDYGTLSARAVLIDAASGEVLCSHSVVYPHGVMEGDLASTADYESTLEELLQAVTPEKWRDTIAGICVDATSMTMVPLAADGRVLCQLPGLEDNPHAQIKLWKRHHAQRQADEALVLAKTMDCPFLRRTGGTISAEWTLPKVLETRDEAPEVYAQLNLVMDLYEFLTYRLTGVPTRSAGALAFKSLWAPDLGFPPEDYLNALRPGFSDEYRHLLRGEVKRPGDCAGMLSDAWREKLGLKQPVTVASGLLDGHTALVALGALGAGDAALVVGTSAVLTIQTEELHEIEGICGIAYNGLTPGLYGIDSGQNCCGDMLDWFVRKAVPGEVQQEAAEKGLSVHQLLTERIERPWENRMAAADWWNGSRNAPCDLSLPGVITGLTLQTRPEDIYLTLLQSIVCGTKEIIDQCASYGVHVSRLLVSGGMAQKNSLLMQEYANLLNMPVMVGHFSEGPALGSAIFAAVACGIYATPKEAQEHMGVTDFRVYEPDQAHRADYDRLAHANHRLRLMAMALREE